MNVLLYERSKLEVLQSNDIALVPDSIEIRELREDKIIVRISYAEKILEVTVFLGRPLDFIIHSSELLPTDYLMTKTPDIDNLSELSCLLVWLLSEVKNYNRDQNPEFSEILSNLSANDVIERDNYELLVEGRQSTMYLKFPVENVELSSFMESVENDRLINNSEQYFILKIVNIGKSQDFSLSFSPSLVRMFPALQTFAPDLEESDLFSMVVRLKASVTEKILQMKGDWMARAAFLVPLYQDFREERDIQTFINFETMTELQLAFQVKAQKALVEMNVPLDFPENDPTINLFLSSKGSIRMKKFDMKRHFASEVFGEVRLFHEELLNILKEYIEC